MKGLQGRPFIPRCYKVSGMTMIVCESVVC